MANPYTITTGSGDAVAARTRYHLKNFTDWLSTNNMKGLIGEVGWPGSSQAGTDPLNGGSELYQQEWDAVAQQWFLDANATGIYWTTWVTSEWGIGLRQYRTGDGNNHAYDYRTTNSSVSEQNYGYNGRGGTNLAGADYSTAGGGGAVNLSTTVQPGAGYYYPTPANWALLYGRGVRIIRLPFMWERVQRTLKGPLNGDITLLVNAVTAAGQAGIKVILDQHNYGRYDTGASGNTGYSTNGVLNLGDNAPSTVGGTMTSAFADFWSKMANTFKGNPGLWCYGLTNEPHDLTGGLATWQEASRQATEAIRLVDQTSYIAVPGYSYAAARDFGTTNGTTAWLTETIPAGQTGAGSARNTDPLILIEAHHYWDATSNAGAYSGTYSNTYATELTSAQNAGYTSYSNTGYTAPPTGNTQQTGTRTIFKSGFDSTDDFSAQYDERTTGSNTVTLPSTTYGNPGNSMKITSTSTGDTAGVKKVLTGGNVFRIYSIDVLIPSGSTITTNNFVIAHMWQDNSSTDFFEVALQGSGTGFIAGLRNPASQSTPYALINSGNTTLAMGTWNTIRVVVTNTAVNLYVNGSSTAEATLSGSFSNVNIGAVHTGKYYGGYVGDMYFDNLLCGLVATYFAPPNGGLLPLANVVVSALLGLLVDF